MRNTKDLYLQLVQAFDSSTIGRKKLYNYIKQKATLVQKTEDILNKIDLVDKG